MKAKITIRNMLLLVFSVIVLCSVMGMSASAADTVCNCDLGDSGWTVYADMPCLEQKWCSDHKTWVKRPIDDPSVHTPGLWTETVIHTCNNPGLETIKCVYCDEYVFRQRVVPAHDYQELYGEEATCMQKGYSFLACVKCFDMKTEEIDIIADAHKFSDWQITTEANCVNESGVRTKFCLCTDENGVQCTETITEKYTAENNHVETDWNVFEQKIAPTCYASGYLYKTCEGCGQEISKELPRHSESSYSVISSVASTCHTHGTERRKCKCGLEYDFELSLDADKHEYSEWRTVKEPSCTFGKMTRKCKYHYDVVEEKTLLANGEHKFGAWVTTVEPTCTLTGVQEQTCSDCGKVMTRELETKHDYTYWVEAQEMICDESNPQNGKKHAKCNSCTYEKTFTIPALHNYGSWIIEELATCENGATGVRKKICTDCGKVYRETYVVEHEYTDWYFTQKPECAKDGKSGFEGQRTRWCKNCKHYEKETVPATHQFEAVELIRLPDCTDSGEVIAECIFCGVTEKQYPDAVGHKYGEAEIGTGIGDTWKAIAEKDITCNMNLSEKRTCVHCLKSTYTSIKAGHNYGNWSCEGGFTCSAEGGKQMTRACLRCKQTETKTVTLNHPNLKTVVTEATCATSGYTREICPDCGYTKLISDITPAKGHKLANKWITKLEPTCSSMGSKYRPCENCDYIEYVEIERSEHLLVALEEGASATCTSAGRIPKSYCTYCRIIVEGQDIPALEHRYADGSETCVLCGSYKDTNCTCACHSQSGMEKIFFNLINKLYQMFGINQECKCGKLHYEEVGFLAKLFGKGK